MKRHMEGFLWAVSIAALLLAAMISSKFFLLILAIAWAACTLVVIPLHFYRAWKRWPDVPNRREYMAWVGFETVATVVLISIGIYSVISK